MAPPTVAIATQGAQRRRSVQNDGRMTARRCPSGIRLQARSRSGRAAARSGRRPPKRIQSPRQPCGKPPGAEHPQEEGLANNPSADSARPDSARWSGARRLRTRERCARTVTLMRNAASIAVAATADHGGPTATALWRRFPLSPTLERVRTTDVGSVADWDDHRRRKVVKMILCRESQPGGLSPCLGSGRGRRYARQRSSEPAAPADVAETRRRGWVLAACSLLALLLDRRSGHVADMTASGVDPVATRSIARRHGREGTARDPCVPGAVILARCYRVDRLAACSSMGPVRRCAKRAALPPHRCKRGRPLAYRRPLGAASVAGLRPAAPVSSAWVKRSAARPGCRAERAERGIAPTRSRLARPMVIARGAPAVLAAGHRPGSPEIGNPSGSWVDRYVGASACSSMMRARTFLRLRWSRS